MRYAPDATFVNVEALSAVELARYVKKELTAIGDSFSELYGGRLEVVDRAPTRYREGELHYASATWNPVSLGKGLVYYDGSAWRQVIQANAPTLIGDVTITGTHRILFDTIGSIDPVAANNFVVYNNYNAATGALYDAAKTAWAVALGDSADRLAIYRSPSGAASFTRLFWMEPSAFNIGGVGTAVCLSVNVGTDYIPVSALEVAANGRFSSTDAIVRIVHGVNGGFSKIGFVYWDDGATKNRAEIRGYRDIVGPPFEGGLLEFWTGEYTAGTMTRRALFRGDSGLRLLSDGQASGKWFEFWRSDSVAIFDVSNVDNGDGFGDFVIRGNPGSGMQNAVVVRRSTLGVGIMAGSGTPVQTRLQVGAKVTDDNVYTYDGNTLYVVHQTATGTSTLNDPKEVMLLARQGISGQAYGAAASFRLSRYENAGFSSAGSRTRLDLVLAHDQFLASPTTVLKLFSDGRLAGTALHLASYSGTQVNGTSDQFIASGTYTPTGAAVSNVASVTPSSCQWLRVGNVVTVAGHVNAAATASGSAQFTLTLPIPTTSGSDFRTLGGAAGAANANVSAWLDLSTSVAAFLYTAPSSASLDFSFSFTYVIL